MAVFYDNLNSVRESKREYVKVVLRYIAYFNNAINFYIYICFSSEFRKEFVKSIKSMLRIKGGVSLCSTGTTTLGSNNVLNNDDNIRVQESGMIPTKPASTRKMPIYNRYSNNTNSTSDSNQPFIANDEEAILRSNNAVEKFKQNTRNTKLFYYKSNSKYRDQSKFRKNDDDFNNNINKPFISPYPTYV